jgi:hypothetical protein
MQVLKLPLSLRASDDDGPPSEDLVYRFFPQASNSYVILFELELFIFLGQIFLHEGLRTSLLAHSINTLLTFSL